MRCRECEWAKRHAEGAVWCTHYGIYISEAHECTLEGRKERGNDDQRGEGEKEAKV